MTTRAKKWTWLSLIPALLLAAGLIAAFVRVQAHTEDEAKHLTREILGHEYVPRMELDYRLDAQMDILTEISDDVKEIRKEQRAHD